MDYLFQDGGKPKKTKSKTSTKSKSTKTKSKSKTSTKTGTKTTKSKTTTKKSSSKKGGNFLGAVGDLVAPTGWGPFATAAGLLALDRADSALRRGKSTKSSAKKGGMRGGNEYDDEAIRILQNNSSLHQMFKTLYKYAHSAKISAPNDTRPSVPAIDKFIKQELENRRNLAKGISDVTLQAQILESLKDLESLQQIGSNSPRGFSNYNSLSTAENEIMNYFETLKRWYRKPKYLKNQ